jgi:hypothetical protein
MWEVRSISGRPVTCVLSMSPRTVLLSIAIGGTEIVVERFSDEADARRYAKSLYADFIAQGCVKTSKPDS